MQYGLHAANSGPHTGRDMMVALALLGERLGYSTLYFGDHVAIPELRLTPHPTVGEELVTSENYERQCEPIVSMAYIAGITSRIKLLTSVLVVPQRNPLLTAKQLATLNNLSGGRLIVGVGVGWQREEFEALAADFDHRGAVADEYLEIYRRAFTQRTFSFEGKHYSFGPIHLGPKPEPAPPPIWVGGDSRVAIRRAVRIGNGLHMSRLSVEMFRQRRAWLQEECDAKGRDIGELTVSLKVPVRLEEPRVTVADLAGSVDEIVRQVRELRDAGVQQLMVEPRPLRAQDEMVEIMERFWTEVVPRAED